MVATVSYQTRQRTKLTEIPKNVDNGKEAKGGKRGDPKTKVDLSCFPDKLKFKDARVLIA